MLKPGEQVVSAVQFRDMIVVFGSYGTVLIMEYDINLMFRVHHFMDL